MDYGQGMDPFLQDQSEQGPEAGLPAVEARSDVRDHLFAAAFSRAFHLADEIPFLVMGRDRAYPIWRLPAPEGGELFSSSNLRCPPKVRTAALMRPAFSQRRIVLGDTPYRLATRPIGHNVMIASAVL